MIPFKLDTIHLLRELDAPGRFSAILTREVTFVTSYLVSYTQNPFCKGIHAEKTECVPKGTPFRWRYFFPFRVDSFSDGWQIKTESVASLANIFSLKAPSSSKKYYIFFIQERFNQLIYSINAIIKCGIWLPVKFQLVSFLNWIKNEVDFLSYLWINVGNTISEIWQKSFHFKNERLTETRNHILCLY